MKRLSIAAVVLAAALEASAQTPPAQQQPPKFQSSVEVMPVDVTVVDDHGKPIRDLAPADFNVKVDGNARRVVSAEWVSLVTEKKTSGAVAPLPEGYSSNESTTGGRLIVLAVDEPNIRFGAARSVMMAASAFIDRLSSSDRIAAIGFAPGSPATPFTADHDRVKKAIARMTGQKRSGLAMLQFNIALSEAVSIANGDRSTTDLVVSRECRNERSNSALEACRQTVEGEALQIARDAQQGADQTLRMLQGLFAALAAIDAPKTVILMSEGFIMDGTSPLVAELGAMAARARTSLYALELEENLFAATESHLPVAPMADKRARTEGLDMLAGAARGTLFTVTGDGALSFERIENELAGYYLLGIEADPRDRDGRPHPVRVEVPRRGALVRARRQLVTAGAGARPLAGREAVVASLASPLVASALPLRVASFSLQGPESSKVQVLIHADVGVDYTTAKRVSIGYTITDRDGRLVDSQAMDTRLTPMVNGVPSPLEFVAGASVPPGDYTLKLAAADGDRAGSIEHPVHAALVDAGAVKLSELMLGGPADVSAGLRPTVGYTVLYGNLHGYVEAYGGAAAGVKVMYEVATDAAAPAILTSDVPPRQAGDGRVVFTRVLQVRQLPAGKYVLRAIVSSSGGDPIKTLTRAFELSPPPVLMTSATGIGDNVASTDGELFLPIEDRVLEAPFRREHAVADSTLEPFRSRLAPAAKGSFEKGVGHFAKGEYTQAEQSFKAAVQPDTDSAAPLAYLAACFAASGHDAEAASAWQTALVDGADIPQIYEWLGEALLRTHALAEARSVFEEAAARWPTDVRFTQPLAYVYASFGKGREAVRTLERYISAGHPDPEALALGVQWIYEVHAAGGLVHNRAEDLKLARSYADQYSKLGGAKQQLVKQWMLSLEARD